MPLDGSLEDKLDHTVTTFGTIIANISSPTKSKSVHFVVDASKFNYIEIQNVKNFINDDFVVEFWAKTAGIEPFLGLFNINGGTNNLYLCVAGNGFFHLFKPTNTSSDILTNSTIKMLSGIWAQLKIERKENILSLYQNGQLVVTHSNPITAVIPGETVTVYLGKPPNNLSNHYSLQGFISDVRIYKPEYKHEYVFKATSNKVTNYFDDNIYLSANTIYDFTPNTNIIIERPVAVSYSKELKITFTITNSTLNHHQTFKASDRVYNIVESAEV
ncbi:hypothetical protein ABK040_003110 [Willaertia magna]